MGKMYFPNDNINLYSGRIDSIGVDSRVIENGVCGVRIHIDMTVINAMGKQILVAVYFSHFNGIPLKDFNNRYCTETGQVATHTEYVCNSNFTWLRDLTIFIPNSEFHLYMGEPITFNTHVFIDNKIVISKYDTKFHFFPNF